MGLASAMYEGLYPVESFTLPTKNVVTAADLTDTDPLRNFMDSQDVSCAEIVLKEFTYKSGDLGVTSCSKARICQFVVN